MISKAKASFLRISPRKTRLVADLIRGKKAIDALYILQHVNKKAKVYLAEVLKAAIANAKKRYEKLDETDLYISKLTIDGGPFLARYRAASMGRATMIKHRTSHINLELDSLAANKQPQEQVSSKKLPLPEKEEAVKLQKKTTKRKTEAPEKAAKHARKGAAKTTKEAK